MLYGSTAARHRMGVSARAYRALHQWARERVDGFSGRHEDMSWPLFDGLTAADLLQLPNCGHATVDEIAVAMAGAGMPLPGHAEIDRPVTLSRGSKVYVAGRSRAMVVTDFAPMGHEMLLRLRVEE